MDQQMGSGSTDVVKKQSPGMAMPGLLRVI
jgi:hypothetical protein